MRRIFGPDIDRDIEEELRFHLEMKSAELEARGLAPDVARRVARERFGDIEDVRGWLRRHDRRKQRRVERVEYMDTLLQDLRYGARKLLAQPGFTTAIVIVLGLGIGAATAMFSAVDAALLRALPFPHADRLVAIRGVNLPFFMSERQSAPLIGDLRAMPDVFEAAGAYAAPGGLNLGLEGSPQRLRVALVTTDLFATVGVGPIIGRGFVDEERSEDAPRVVILAHGLWQRQFGGDAGIVGQQVQLDGRPYEVIGVMPRGFSFPAEADVWLPLHEPFGWEAMRPFEQFLPHRVIARLAPGVTTLEAGARLHLLAQRWATERVPSTLAAAERATPFRDQLMGNKRTALLVLLGATGLVLLVACANVTNLLLSRAAARRGEMALRATLGASRARLVRQLLVETLLLALAGGALGVMLAYASLGALGALLPAEVAGLVELAVDARVLAFTLVVAATTGLIFGLWPALGASRTNVADAIRAGGVTAVGGGARDMGRLRRAFVVVELAIALMLAIGTGLMLRSLQQLVSTEIGLLPERVATMELSLAGARYDSVAARRVFFESLRERLLAVPGVEAVGMINDLPLRENSGGIALTMWAEGTEMPADREAQMFAQMLSVGGDYFRAMGIPLLRGRLPEPTPPRTDTAAPPAVGEAVVNETFARLQWPGENPVGRRFHVGDFEVRQVVGVVGDVRARTLNREPMAQQYTSIDRSPPRKLAVVARGTLPATALARHMREAVIAIDGELPPFNVRPMSAVVAAAATPWRLNTLLITTFGIVAVVLAAVGVYAVVAFGVAQRRREFGIRRALGAQHTDVLGLVMRESVLLAAIGLTLGLAGAWAVRRVIGSLLYGVTPSDAVAFTAAPVVLFAVALLAAMLPARAAARVEPTVMMRE